MPLHDWHELPNWDGMHTLWMTEILRDVQPRLPAGYRVYLGTAPALAIDAPAPHPDVSVRTTTRGAGMPPREGPTGDTGGQDEPDVEVAVLAIDPTPVMYVEQDGRLVTALELISPRNKGRPASRRHYLGRYTSYLAAGVNLMLVDVHAHPYGFSFADVIVSELDMAQPPLAVPLAVSYRVGEPAATGGRLLAIWRRSLRVGEPLPSLPLPLNVHESVGVNLESTYMTAAGYAYLT